MAAMVYKGAMQLKKVAELIHARLIGNGDVEIEQVCSIESASAGDLIFVEDKDNLPRALKSSASAVLQSPCWFAHNRAWHSLAPLVIWLRRQITVTPSIPARSCIHPRDWRKKCK